MSKWLDSMLEVENRASLPSIREEKQSAFGFDRERTDLAKRDEFKVDVLMRGRTFRLSTKAEESLPRFAAKNIRCSSHQTHLSDPGVVLAAGPIRPVLQPVVRAWYRFPASM
jgi:hypothetical protein